MPTGPAANAGAPASAVTSNTRTGAADTLSVIERCIADCINSPLAAHLLDMLARDVQSLLEDTGDAGTPGGRARVRQRLRTIRRQLAKSGDVSARIRGRLTPVIRSAAEVVVRRVVHELVSSTSQSVETLTAVDPMIRTKLLMEAGVVELDGPALSDAIRGAFHRLGSDERCAAVICSGI
jgi:hypothetical protein